MKAKRHRNRPRLERTIEQAIFPFQRAVFDIVQALFTYSDADPQEALLPLAEVLCGLEVVQPGLMPHLVIEWFAALLDKNKERIAAMNNLDISQWDPDYPLPFPNKPPQ